MILSRILAKSRIARDELPSRLGAWVPVAFDAAVLFAILFSLFPWLNSWMSTEGFGVGLKAIILFVLYFVPIQIVLIGSAYWAARSRVSHSDANTENNR